MANENQLRVRLVTPERVLVEATAEAVDALAEAAPAEPERQRQRQAGKAADDRHEPPAAEAG